MAQGLLLGSNEESRDAEVNDSQVMLERGLSLTVGGLHLLGAALRGTRWQLKRPDKRLRRMTCRIDRLVAGDNGVVLCVSGGITGQHVDTLRNTLEHEGKTVAVDLKDVLLVDRDAVRLLALCESNGTELRNCPAYVREWVARERAQMRVDRSGPRTEERED